jgi:protein-tyrosine kinase
MSLIEKALRKASERRDAEPLQTHRSPAGKRQRIAPPPAVDLSQVRAYRQASLDQAVLRRNRVLPTLTDRAAVRGYKILRTRVLQRMAAMQGSLLGVTGTAPAEGKSLTSINMAIALAQDVNTWVYLVDLDLQRPKVSEYLGLSADLGLGDYLSGKAGLGDVLYDVGIDRLSVLPNVSPSIDSSELLTSPKMAELVAELQAEKPRRIVIFDMPPLTLSDDVLGFAPSLDAMLLVVSEGMTERSALEGVKDLLSDVELLGVVLNRSRDRNDTAYYY